MEQITLESFRLFIVSFLYVCFLRSADWTVILLKETHQTYVITIKIQIISQQDTKWKVFHEMFVIIN